jgi:hypothetical protein
MGETSERLMLETIRRHVSAGAELVAIAECVESGHSHSGAQIRRYSVSYLVPDLRVRQTTLLTKEASLVERRTTVRLCEQGHDGSFYLDLPDYFAPPSVEWYREALGRLGPAVPAGEFTERYRDAGRHVGFKYMPVCLAMWRRGGPERDRARPLIANLVRLALRDA